jgi:uncharacterized protein (TIGR02147 family)
VHDFQGDHEELGRLLNPAITAAEARDAVDLLLRLKLIRKTAHGGHETTDRVVLPGPQISPTQVRPALYGHLDLARRALEEFAPRQRPFSYLTLSVSESSFQQIHEKLRVLSREIFGLVTQDQEVDRLYQLNLQFFPLSEVIKRRKK